MKERKPKWLYIFKYLRLNFSILGFLNFAYFDPFLNLSILIEHKKTDYISKNNIIKINIY